MCGGRSDPQGIGLLTLVAEIGKPRFGALGKGKRLLRVALFKRDRTLFWGFALVIIFDMAWALNYEIAEDKDAYYLPTFLTLAIAAGSDIFSFALP